MDGVKVYRTQKAWIYSFSSALSKGPVLESKIVLAILRESTNAKPLTHDRMGHIVGWMCECLQSGVFPVADMDGCPWPRGSKAAERAGQDIAPGWKLAFSGFKSDLEARIFVHKFPRNYMANHICEHCPAGRKICHFQDFRDEAPFMECQFTHQQYQIMTPPAKQSSWLSVAGWTKDRNLEDCASLESFFYWLAVES